MSGTVWPVTPDGRMLVLRTCNADMSSHGGFVWPESGHVEAPDWDPDPARDCGGGLHGLLWGCGDAGLLSDAEDARWLVVAVEPADFANVDQPDKVRFRRCEVVLVGSRDGATAHLIANGAWGLPVVYGTATAGHFGTATAGDYGTATAGDYGTATAGYSGTATAGDFGTATAGDYGTATAGDSGTATAGHSGTATAGHFGTATAGDSGTATAGHSGTATAGRFGTVVVKWWDGKRYRLAVGYCGEDGIEAGVAYGCDEAGKLVAP